MIRSIAIDQTLTGAGNLSTAEEILGIRLTEPRTKWNPGQLAQAAVNRLSAATVIIMTANRLAIYTPANATAAAAVVAQFSTPLLEGAVGGIFTASPGTSRVRTLDAVGVTVSASVTSVPAGQSQALHELLMLPERPELSAYGALSRIYDAYQVADASGNNALGNPAPQDFLCILDQFTGEIQVGVPTSPVNDGSLADALVVYRLSSVDAPETPVGPVWG